MMMKLGLMALLLSGALVAQEVRPISIFELSEQTLGEFMEGNLQEMVVYCPEGYVLPFQVTIKGEFLALETQPLYLKICKTCYARCAKGQGPLFSSDLKEWRTCDDFFTGEICTSMQSYNGKKVATLDIEINERH